ncbi:MAG: Ig-like domain-containing protein, partial [Patescibacteria group bacterium]
MDLTHDPFVNKIYIAGGSGELVEFNPSGDTATDKTSLISGFTNFGNMMESLIYIPGSSIYFGADNEFFGKYTPALSSGTFQSTKINSGTDNVVSATLTKTDLPGSGTVTYSLSNNGGTNWNTVTPGSLYTFGTTGNDLRWKAVLTGNAVVSYLALSWTEAPANTAPAATVPNTISQSTDGLGRITFQTAISDSDSNNTKLKVEYSEDNGTTWYKAQLASVSPSSGSVDLTNANAYQIGTTDAIDTSTGSKTLTIVWDAKSASNENGVLTGDQTDIKIRVTANDNTADGATQASSAFEVDNLNPSGIGSLSFSGVTTEQIAASWSQATETNFQRYRLYYGISQSDVENQTSSYYQSVSISTTQTTLTGLTSATTYYFKLFAADIYGNSFSTSTANQATQTPSVVIPPPPLPAAPPPEVPPTPEVPPEEVPPEEEPEEKPKPLTPLVTSISDGETINQNTFTLQGVAPAYSTVIMVLDNRSITQTTTNSSGTFTFFLFNLTDGSHTLRLQTKDAAGNVSDASYFTFNVDVPRELEKTAEEQKIYPEAAPAEVPPAGGEIPGAPGEAAPGGAGGPSIPITPSPVEAGKETITPPIEERLLPQVVQTITQTIAETPKNIIRAVAKIQEAIPKPHQKWEDQTPIEKTVNVAAQTIVTTGAATGAALSTGLVTLNVGRLAVTFGDINLMLIRAFTTLLSVAGIRRKKSKPWGTVYDSQTKPPLDPAYVQLLDEKGNELETQITDLEGRFGFFVKQT